MKIISEKLKEKYKCRDCQIRTDNFEYYVVHDHIWYEAVCKEPVISKYSLLCIGCIEHRLGRELQGEDFKNVLVNDLSFPWGRSDRLINRLSRIKK